MYKRQILHFLHVLTRDYGLLVLNMDNKELKKLFIPIMEKEIVERKSEGYVVETQKKLQQLGYKPQAHAREINLFYFTEEGGRERITFQNNIFHILNTLSLIHIFTLILDFVVNKDTKPDFAV